MGRRLGRYPAAAPVDGSTRGADERLCWRPRGVMTSGFVIDPFCERDVAVPFAAPHVVLLRMVRKIPQLLRNISLAGRCLPRSYRIRPRFLRREGSRCNARSTRGSRQEVCTREIGAENPDRYSRLSDGGWRRASRGSNLDRSLAPVSRSDGSVVRSGEHIVATNCRASGTVYLESRQIK
jgi:hypothetical protein